MHIVVDIGNTRIKTGEFIGQKMSVTHIFDTLDECRIYLQTVKWDAAIASSVSTDSRELFACFSESHKVIYFDHTTPIPLTVAYRTPHTLGLDRLAAACGAATLHPAENSLVIDAGTSITYEIVEKGRVYLGGAISPGLNMRAKALHNFTARLPLIELPEEAPLIGKDTKSCLESGVLNGARGEIRDFIRMYREKFSNLRIIICGGDAKYFESVSESPVLLVPGLVLLGLNAILNYNVQKNG
ncbi:type III pantothenate kinase [Roseivirga sp. BDSF3-8]|uniref:type III pantothenate kinase n=1 Tax=Roseivirga sp. BDSF3-8 TaxID=3241598 RepID=UPI00353230A7